MNILQKTKSYLQERINLQNRKRLRHDSPILVSSNCTGGFLYHWLGLRFMSPFINLYLTPADFVLMCENFNDFLNFPLQKGESESDYPIGVGYLGIKVHFMHYATFEEAITSWEKRLKRMERESLGNGRYQYKTEKIGFIFSNWDGNEELLERFDKLPFKKVVFTDKHVDYSSAVYLRGYERKKGNVYATKNIFGKRYIDQFDYVEFINSLTETTT